MNKFTKLTLLLKSHKQSQILVENSMSNFCLDFDTWKSETIWFKNAWNNWTTSQTRLNFLNLRVYVLVFRGCLREKLARAASSLPGNDSPTKVLTTAWGAVGLWTMPGGLRRYLNFRGFPAYLCPAANWGSARRYSYRSDCSLEIGNARCSIGTIACFELLIIIT